MPNAECRMGQGHRAQPFVHSSFVIRHFRLMSDVIASPPPVPPRVKSVVLHPGFLRAVQGLWSFTWRAQLTWRRVPLLLVTLMAIPLLTFFTLEPLAHLTSRYDWREQPHKQVSEFKVKAVAAGAGLRQGLGTRMTQII